MDETKFDIFFHGRVASGYRPAEVKESLKALFKADDKQLEQLFSGRPVAIRRNLDAETAKRYQETLAKAGAMVDLRASDSANQPTQSPTPAQSGEHSADAVAAASGWTLTPVGADLLRQEERIVAIAVSVDASALRIEPPGADLLRPEERKSVVAAPIDTSRLSLEPPAD